MTPKITANGREIDDPSWNGAVSRALANTTGTTASERIEVAQALADGHAAKLGGVEMEPTES